MELTLPIYVEVKPHKGQPVHVCRPLFIADVQATDAHLGLAMSKLSKRLKQHLDALGSRARHDALSSAAFSPALETRVLRLAIELKDATAKCRLLFVMFPALGRRVAFSPSLPEIWFDIERGALLEDRATEVLTQHFRKHEREARKAGVVAENPAAYSLTGQAWVTTIDLEVRTKQVSLQALEKKFASLFDEMEVDGAMELQRVGRCLDWLYPDELDRAACRDREVTQLNRLLAAPDQRPVVLVGPRLVGKTTVLHECVRRRVDRRGKPYAAKRNVWLLSPQRLISGMMYVGQWEGRVQAILKEARRRRHVLYFDDFLGLYHAGISRDASLCVAEVLKPFIHRREVRVLAELTPEAWQTLQERDRGLADQFHVLRIAPTTEEQTRQILLDVQRNLEAEHRCRFDLEALVANLHLQQAYIRDAAFPGKAAAFARQLARKNVDKSLSHGQVLEEFHEQTGLALVLLNDREKLERDTVITRLRAKLVGQAEAVEAAADVIAVAKARLNDGVRPLATLLFLGPTGVGKTQCAKALAETMFSDASRLLRFDMNEFVSPHAVSRLVGTLSEPEGLLTSAVRRQPFSVVLLDEIEKAHPDVFDLLLQVTGEGRLTDALGRTADFTNCVIVMTSNLGTTAGGQALGLAPPSTAERQVFVKAAERYFRPEFYNRIDRVIPFAPLTREQMRTIAEMLLASVFQRDGLVRRRCALGVEGDALEHVIDAGYHPQFGARALKRALEQQLVQPVAASLAGIKPELPALIRVLPQPEGVTAHVVPLESVAPVDHSLALALPPEEHVARARKFLERAEAELQAGKPEGGVSSSRMSPAQLRYYALKEQWQQVREQTRQLEEALTLAHKHPVNPAVAPRTPGYGKRLSSMVHRERSELPALRDLHAAQDIHAYLREAAEASAARPEELRELGITLLREATYLHAVQSSAGTPERAIVVFQPLVQPANAWARRLWWLTGQLATSLGYQLELGPDQWPPSPWAVNVWEGAGVWPLLQSESGVHVLCQPHENLLPVQVSVLPATSAPAVEQLAALIERRQRWLAQLRTGQALPGDDPLPVGKIVRFQDEGGPMLDLRSGLTLPAWPDAEGRKALLFAGLPLPPEWEV